MNTLLKDSFPQERAVAPVPKKRGNKANQRQELEATVNTDITLWTSPTPKLTLTFSRAASAPSRSNGVSAKPAISLKDLLSNGEAAPNDSASRQVLAPISVAVEILSNAEIVIGENNISSVPKQRELAMKNNSDTGTGGTTQENDDSKTKIARALDVTGDLDIWVEFIRNRILHLK